jgi:ATP-dependent helicase YprA (DUF1998 family)
MRLDDERESGESASGVFQVSDDIAEALARFIEASYHLKNDALIADRAELLRRWGVLRQRPYVEATPSFLARRSIEDLDIPSGIKAALLRYVGRAGGFFNPPFEHQSEALERFFRDSLDIVIATGTGSGKTEAFFMPIIGALEQEIDERPRSSGMSAVRALLLYPMNALVNDQLIRLRRLLGNEDVIRRAMERRGRPIRFSSYTGRTPYPGLRSAARDSRYVAPLFEDFYLPLLDDEQKRDLLRAVGRWPIKDLKPFYAKSLEQRRTIKSGSRSGEQQVVHNWSERLITQPNDAELLIRDEALKSSPDILITNYSMLEYMLLRPLERAIFDQTAAWLEADKSNQFIIVLDEAHLYRGAGGAEVGLLIRRLISRLRVARDRVRVIITSASIGSGSTGEEAALKFATDLTGDPAPRRFHIVRSTLEAHADVRPMSAVEVEAFADFPLDLWRNLTFGETEVVEALRELAQKLDLEPPSLDESVDVYLGRILAPLPFVQLLIQLTTAQPKALVDLAVDVCGGAHARKEKALASLLALCAAGSRPDGRKLLSSRLHVFMRGLPSLWACCDSECDAHEQQEGAIAGKLYVAPVERCSCTRNARVFELLSHRDCGAAFLQGYVTSRDSQFIWSEPGSLPDGMYPPRRLRPIEMLIEGEPHPDFKGADVAFLDVRSGRLSWKASNDDGVRRVWLPPEDDNNEMRFRRCPVCLGRWRSQQSAIERHSTAGEGSFSVITRAQLRAQPEVPPRPDQLAELNRYPNHGRKVLVFSDGRQRAAKLARIMPDLSQKDAFRQAILKAADRLQQLERQPLLTNRLYTAFVDVVSESGATFFTGASQRELMQHVDEYRRHGAVLDEALEEPFDRRPAAYDCALLDALGGRFYSLEALCLAYVEPSDAALKQILSNVTELDIPLTPQEAKSLAITWITEALRDYAFDERLTPAERRSIAHYYRDAWGFDEKFPTSLKDEWQKVRDVNILDTVAKGVLSKVLTSEGAPKQRFLNPRQLKLVNAVDLPWYHCNVCQALRPTDFDGRCISCLVPGPELLDPQHPYLMARKEFWRAPVRRAISGDEQIATMVAAEHTAQLSYRDRASVYSTTEKHELLFQDILITPDDRPIDVLSCTTTMEVGIDIGSLVAVGLRNVPPERSNYQQRAGRAGRRGASVSTVLAFADRGPHDSYYFADPSRIISGPPRTPEIKVDNQKLVRRHIASFVLQRFFAHCIDSGITSVDRAATLEASLGPTYEFFRSSDYGANLEAFNRWLNENTKERGFLTELAKCLPSLTLDIPTTTWISAVCEDLLATLTRLRDTVPPKDGGPVQSENDRDDLDTGSYPRQLLEFCSLHGLLPTYALPVDLASFIVDEPTYPSDLWRAVKIVEQPQQDMAKALSEYAPGRIVTINGIDYRSGAVASNTPSFVKDRAAPLFVRAQKVWFCPVCNALRTEIDESVAVLCTTCGSPLNSHLVLQPEVFYPENREGVSEDDRAQERTYATAAQLPLPAHEEDLPPFSAIGRHIAVTHAANQELVSVNKGLHEAGEDSGFWVCRLCGLARVEKPKERTHLRAYTVEGPRDKDLSTCKGSFVNVFLGRRFRTDLLALRFQLTSPLVSDLHSIANIVLLETAFTTVSQALVVAASRHRELDIDPQEFGSGFRFAPASKGSLNVDVYLYDTLAGGAGYADIAGQYITEILSDTLSLLENCPAGCSRSCPDCLRHFRNQHLVDKLDRNLGAQLLRFVLYGEEPKVHNSDKLLNPLARWLETDGCKVVVADGHLEVHENKVVRNVRVVPSLTLHIDGRMQSGDNLQLGDFVLERDLPHCHMLVRQALAAS